MTLTKKKLLSAIILLTCLLLLSFAAIYAKTDIPTTVLAGDIIFHTSQSNQSLAIQKATHSKYSHMGIILLKQGKPYVFEASRTVRYTPLKEWIERGVGKHYVIKRLKNSDELLDESAIAKLTQYAREFEGKPYDLTFEWSDQRMYCSELVWKMYDRGLNIQLGELQQIKDFDLTNPAVKAKLYERYGNNIPLAEPVISPQAMFDSELLETVITQ